MGKKNRRKKEENSGLGAVLRIMSGLLCYVERNWGPSVSHLVSTKSVDLGIMASWCF